ncbi:MAG: UvrD-helicase domain-containing protein [Candidatus Vogelbacteria bacterium]|nr:UvrD-helicase domain-containing protein [Candidatus Vogelbacteria bacterium]
MNNLSTTNSNLNEAQQSAANHKDGPLLIIAGAGAGKTKTIAHRIENLVAGGILPHKILAVTFTNKAAKEMRERIERLLSESRGRNQEVRADTGPTTTYNLQPTTFPFVATFHGLGVQIIKENAGIFGTTKYFTILDKSETLSLIKKALKDKGFDPKIESPGRLQNFISGQKNKLVSYVDFKKLEPESYFYEVAEKVWGRYEQSLNEQKSFDFDDLILKPVRLFREHPDILERYQDRWTYIHIDEYQDTNKAQYELSRLLSDKHKNICVVGDADQSVYGWRGADFKNILDFEENFPNSTVVLLEENYRSTKIILDTANEIIKKNKLRKEKNLFTRKTGGEKISVYEAFDEADEARNIAKNIDTILKSGVKLEEIAVLYRANFQSRAIEEALLLRGVQYQVLGTKFYDRKEIKDTIAFVRASMNEKDYASWERIINVPARGIGDVTFNKIISGRLAELPQKMQEKVRDFERQLVHFRDFLLVDKLSESIKKIIRESGMEKMYTEGSEEDEERLENLKELVTIATKYDLFPPEEAVERFLTDTGLMSDQDSLKERGGGVKLMTIHASKGLEFRHVFVTGLEQGLFPHERLESSRSMEEENEEERRLFYVAVTRAKEKLHLSYAICRTIFGNRRTNLPSEYLGDISEDVIDLTSAMGNSSGRQYMYSDPEAGDDVIQWGCLGGGK